MDPELRMALRMKPHTFSDSDLAHLALNGGDIYSACLLIRRRRVLTIGEAVDLFSPTHKVTSEQFDLIKDALQVVKRANQQYVSNAIRERFT